MSTTNATAEYLKKAHRSRRRGYRRNKRLVLAYLLEHRCVDCGESDTLLLEFDHRDPECKIDDVARLAQYRPRRFVIAEINKCEVRWANCHGRRTARQFGWTKLLDATAA